MPLADRLAQLRHLGDGLPCRPALFRQERQQGIQGQPGIALQRHGTGIEIVELARVDIDADQLAGQRQAFAPEVGIGHLGAHRQHQVGLLDHLPARRHTEAGAGIQRRLGGQQALAGNTGEHRRGQSLAERLHGFGGLQRTAAGDDHRPRRGGQLVRRRLQRLDVGQATAGAAHHFMTPVARHRGGEHIERHGDMHRARPLAVEHRKGAGDQLGQVLGGQGHGGEGGDRRGNGALVLGFVQAAPAFAEAGRVVDAGNHQHRDRIGVGLANGRRGIGHARAGDDEAHAGLATDPRIAVSHEAGALLVARQHMADAAAGQATVELQGVYAGDAEHGVDAVVGQQADQGLAAGEGFRILHGVISLEACAMPVGASSARENPRHGRSRAELAPT
ncbi:hypothetical protein D3C85_944200 [compost metagenome]